MQDSNKPKPEPLNVEADNLFKWVFRSTQYLRMPLRQHLKLSQLISKELEAMGYDPNKEYVYSTWSTENQERILPKFEDWAEALRVAKLKLVDPKMPAANIREFKPPKKGMQ